MSSAKKNNPRKVPPKKIKDNVNSALKTVTKPEDVFSKADRIVRSGNPVPPPVAKELLSNFYDSVLCKYEPHEQALKSEEITPDTTEARFAKQRPKSNQKRRPGSSGLLPIPCTNDLCSKVRQLVQMNNKVQSFRKKFLEVPPDSVDEKRALQKKKLKVGNEYSKRNISKKASKLDKYQQTADEGGCGCETTKKVRWSPEKLTNHSDDLERLHSHNYFTDCLDDDLSSTADSVYDGFQPNLRTERQYDTDYASCAETDYANSSRNSSKTFVRQSSSAKMLVHFRELLSMHILPRSADQIKCSILSDEDIAFLQTLVEADERYHCLKKDDHNLLKEVLKSQLKQIETQERILAETLTKLRQKAASSEDISIRVSIPNKEKAEQPLEMSEKKEPPYEAMLRDFLKIPHDSEETRDVTDKKPLIVPKTESSTENNPLYTKNESNELFAQNDLEENSLDQQSPLTYSPKNKSVEYISVTDLEDESLHLPSSFPVPLISYPSSPCETPRNHRRSEEGSLQIVESATEPYKDPELVVPLLELDKIDDEPMPGFFKKSFKWFSARERDKTNLLLRLEPKASSVRLEKVSKTEMLEEKFKNLLSEQDNFKDIKPSVEMLEEKFKNSLSEQNNFKDIKPSVVLIERKEPPENDVMITPKDLDDSKEEGEGQSKDLQNPAELFGVIASHKETLKISLEDEYKKNSDIVEEKQVTKEIVDCENIKSTAKLITDEISQTSRVYSKRKTERPTRDQETNTQTVFLKCNIYFENSIEYILFWEDLAVVEVCPLFVARRKHMAKEFRMKYLPVDELYHAGEFFILNSENSEITIEKTNFQILHKEPEKLSKLLQPMYKQPVDKAVSTSEDESNFKFLYPWQIPDYAISEDIMIQNVICCLFKTWATHPELYKQTISNCKSLVPPQLAQYSKENAEPIEDNCTILENKQEICDEIYIFESTDKNIQEKDNELVSEDSIKKQNDPEKRSFRTKMTPKNLLVLSAQFLLFTALVLGLSLFQYKCLEI